MPRITALSIYPVKGMRGKSRETLPINSNVGVVGDRERAYLRLEHQAKSAGTRKPNGWLPKQYYYVGMNTPRMGAFHHQMPTSLLAKELGLPETPSQDFTEGNFNLTDTNGPSVSLLNLATLRTFEQFLHEKGELDPTDQLNPERFRMNIQLDDLAPFAELQLADSFPGTREITLGSLRFRVDDACERCKATHANPITEEYDLKTVPMLTEFMETYSPRYKSPHRGTTAVMGILLVPLEDGILNLGDELQTH